MGNVRNCIATFLIIQLSSNIDNNAFLTGTQIFFYLFRICKELVLWNIEEVMLPAVFGPFYQTCYKLKKK